MDAAPWLAEIDRALRACGLEAVLIGNAAAALQGAPVTTVDFDFMFRKTSGTLRKLRAFAGRLEATVLRPYYPVADMFRGPTLCAGASRPGAALRRRPGVVGRRGSA